MMPNTIENKIQNHVHCTYKNVRMTICKYHLIKNVKINFVTYFPQTHAVTSTKLIQKRIRRRVQTNQIDIAKDHCREGSDQEGFQVIEMKEINGNCIFYLNLNLSVGSQETSVFHCIKNNQKQNKQILLLLL